jgi:4'-phosphopantetheinyl transferase
MTPADAPQFLAWDSQSVRMPAAGEVFVWCAGLDRPDAQIESLRRILSDDERGRADRFHFDKDRRHFTAARGILRTILGGCLDVAPRLVRFSYSEYGKPSLAAGQPCAALRFNVSHSGGLALFAVAAGRELGIDIELIRPDVEHEQIAERFFSPREVMVLKALPERLRAEAFFNCWTRKEAYIKARGEGLSFPLDMFDVAFRPGEPASLIQTLGDPREAERWRLDELRPGAGYVAAIAAEGKDWSLDCWRWPDGG